MDLAAIRADLASTLTGYNLNVYPAIIDSPILPALVVGPPSEIVYNYTFSLAGFDEVTIPITVIAALANEDDAQARLDATLSTRMTAPGSLCDKVRQLAAANDGSHPWQAVRCTGAGNVRIVKVGQADALAADITLEITA